MRTAVQELRPTWQKVWRDGFQPALTTAALEALLAGLRADDPKLLQGATTTPPPLQCVLDWPVEGACAVTYCAWQGDGLESVGEVEEFFARACFEADRRLGEPAACRWFLNWYDDTPREEMRVLMVLEIERELTTRATAESAP